MADKTQSPWVLALQNIGKRLPTDETIAKETSDLHYAATIGDGDLLQKCLLEKSASNDINKSDRNNHTPVYNAVKNNHRDVVSVLLENGAVQNIDAENDKDDISSPLHIVSDLDIAAKLIHFGGDINAIGNFGDTPLHSAILREDLNMVTFLLNKGADVNQCKIKGQTPLLSACRFNRRETNADIIGLLLKKGANVNTNDYFDRTALHYCGENSISSEVVKMLIAKGAKLDMRDYKGNYPIHDLVEHFSSLKNEDKIELISSYAVSKETANLGDKHGRTILHTGIASEEEEVIKAFIALGADVDKCDNAGKTPLFYITDERVDNIDILLKHGAHVSECDKWFWSVLMSAVDRGMKQYVSVLISNHANVQHSDNCGITALHLACYKNEQEIAELLVDNGADVNTVDDYGTTPLHAAVYGRSYQIVEYLMEKGAVYNTQDNNGMTARDIGKGNREMERILTQDENETLLYNETFCDQADVLLDVEEVAVMIDKHEIKRNIEDVRDFVSTILETPGIGRGADDSEAMEIQTLIETTVQTLAKKIAMQDPRFQGKILHAGSSSEGTKTKAPDEFDFMICLEEFSQHCEPDFQTDDIKSGFEVNVHSYTSKSQFLQQQLDDLQRTKPYKVSASVADYIYLNLKRTEEAKSYKRNVGSTTDLLCPYFNYDFAQLTARVLFSEDFPIDPRLIPLEVTVDPALKFLWRGCKYKHMEIDVDFVPAVLLPEWPEKTRTDCLLFTPDILRIPCLAVPKMTSLENEDLWRCSLALAETAIFRRLRPELRNSYIACKAFVSSRILPHINMGNNCEVDKYYRAVYLNDSLDEDLKFYSSAESSIPSYVMKMTFLSTIEQKIRDFGLGSVYYDHHKYSSGASTSNAYAEGTPVKETVGVKLEDRCTQNKRAKNDYNALHGDKDAIYYGPAVDMNIVERSLEYDIDIVREVMSKCEEHLANKFVPSVFNPRHNVLGNSLLSGDGEIVYVFFKIINCLLQKT